MTATTRLPRIILPLLLAVTAALVVSPAHASPRHDAPLDVSRHRVVAAMTCHGNPRTSRRTPVLFLHGTTSSSQADWSWNWNRALRRRHWAYCDVDLPESANADVQVGAEYVVRAITILHHRAGRRIDLVGHSQGGMIGRWALKYWPSTRRMVDDYVGLASSNHGTRDFNAICATGTCTPANWQQRVGSHFLRTLNRGPATYRGISYTEVSTNADEIVVPSTSPYLHGGRGRITNTAVQDLCPTETVDHFGMSYDNAAWLIGLDALTHRGPARLSRISTRTCGRPMMPGVDPTTFATHVAAALAQTASSTATAAMTPSEPRIAGYAR